MELIIDSIKNDSIYEKVLARIEEIFESEPGTQEFAELEALCVLAEEYEDKHYPMGGRE
jgi:HTH-type transcriptional regulator/antitoxin HigA